MNFLTAMLSASSAESAPVTDLIFEPMNFVENLRYMGIGMLVIFVIIGIIILATALINRAFSNQDK